MHSFRQSNLSGAIIRTALTHLRRVAHRIATFSVVGFTLLPALAIEQELPIDFRLNEHVIMIPAGAANSARLQTTVFRPNGPGPFPLLVINHGKEAGDPRYQSRDRFIFMATAFVKRGYAVLVPMRQGFANSTGTYADHGCNMTANGMAQAADVLATIAFARTQPWIDEQRIIIAGQSYGGLATIALGTQAVPGVRGLINFAGGLRDDGAGCDWRAELVRAFGVYGEANKVPSLWMYGINDSLFGPDLVARMHTAFVRAGGRARLHEFGIFKRDSHGMLASRDGEKIWWPEAERFLQQVGMPTREKYVVTQLPGPVRTDFARVDDIDAVPYLSEQGRAAYREYLGKMTPRAFAVSASGAWCWAEEGEEPDTRALATCAQKSGQPCQLYSVDDYVVWQGEPRAPGAIAATAGSDTMAANAEGAAP
ncbi:prolyl oligopeptidase family serine peptidase [Massilia sp. PAMC28688]|uniref:dienelactone hydrolase family protein n=1 Tax=Massilia sp. PAMC28688 TaxID=2861283 RepID=UPI001C62E234|nr:CocE/NonD family hydrolase [Massilia sp. PAMC28688]QYF92336.1 prolyl oligopeptidase family serine peptidase [Massilia sp. PAMC28688]